MGQPVLAASDGGQMVMVNVGEDGGFTPDPDFYINFSER